MKRYPFIAGSLSKPDYGLGYVSEEKAAAHAKTMNRLREEYYTNPIWNREFWKSKPDVWVVWEA